MVAATASNGQEIGTPQRRLRGAERRRRIEEAAVRVFAERGYEATNVVDLANAAGVTRTVLYDHFTSKKELYLAVVTEQNRAMLDAVAAAMTGSGEPRTRMRATVLGYLEFTRDHPWASRLLVAPPPSGDPEIDATVAHHERTRYDAVAAMLAEDLDRTGAQLDALGASQVAAMAAAGVDALTRWRELHPEARLEDIADLAVRLLWGGMTRLGQRPE